TGGRRADNAVDLLAERAGDGDREEFRAESRGNAHDRAKGNWAAVGVLVEIGIDGDVRSGAGQNGSLFHAGDLPLNQRIGIVANSAIAGELTKSALIKKQLAWRHAERNREARDVADGQAVIADADAGEAGFFALSVFVRDEAESPVFFERAAESE